MESTHETDLLAELMGTLIDDVAKLTRLIDQQAQPVTAEVLDPALGSITQALSGLQGQVKHLASLSQSPAASPAPAIDLTGLERQVKALRQEVREKPDYQVSQYVRYGGLVVVLSLVSLVAMTWFGLSWRSERDDYASAYTAANWRLRYTRQANAAYHHYMEGVFAKDKADDLYTWIVTQEQADQKREQAREAAEQAKAMNAQADRLEGKAGTKGKKKDRS